MTRVKAFLCTTEIASLCCGELITMFLQYSISGDTCRPCCNSTVLQSCNQQQPCFKHMPAAENVLLLLGEARIHDALNDMEASLALYKRVLHLDASNVEAMACIAAHHFYTDQPEIALRFYRSALNSMEGNAF
jgi:hypothetical protein